jgi:hypothetical protein
MAAVPVWCLTDFFPGIGRRAIGDGSPRAFVRRPALMTTLKAAGLVESSAHTVIRCEVENTSVSGSYRHRATIILSLVPEGSMVIIGNILCRLDDSDYQE